MFNIDENTSNLLNKKQLTILGLGLKFTPYRSASTNKIQESLHESTEQLHKSLTIQTFFRDPFAETSVIPSILTPSTFCPLQHSSGDNYYKQLHHSITKYSMAIHTKINQLKSTSKLNDMEKLINNTILELRNNKDIVIKPADKNLGTCIMKKSTYLKYCYDIIKDTTTYQLIDPDIYSTLQQQKHLPHVNNVYSALDNILRTHNLYFKPFHNSKKYNNNQTTSTYLPPTNRNLSKLASSLLQLRNDSQLQPSAKFYILLKMHKPTISGRPIVNCINTITYHASKYLSNIMNPIVKLLPTIVHSSTEALLKTSSIQPSITPASILMSADVKNLYPSIPINYGLQAVRSVLSMYMVQNLDFIIDLLQWILENNFIEFNNELYLQKSGTAMGTPCAPPYANLVLYVLERELVHQYKPILYLRYLDDIFALFQDKQPAEDFIKSFNAQLPQIQLDAVNFDVKKVVFLDMEFCLNFFHHSIECQLYQKPSNKYLYIPPSSAHKHHVFKNFIVNEIKRYKLFNSNIQDFHTAKSKFLARLLQRGYTPEFLKPLFNTWIPTREELLQQLSLKKQQNTTNGIALAHRHKDPVVILNLPKIQRFSFKLSDLFKIPDAILNHEYYQTAFPNSKRTFPINANRQGKNMLRLISVDSISPPPTPPHTLSEYRGEP